MNSPLSTKDSQPSHETSRPDTDRRSAWQLAIFSLLFAFPSLPLLHRYLGLAGVFGYVVFVALGWFLIRRCLPRVEDWSSRRFGILCGVLLAGLAVVFAIGYPLENARGVANSSDRDTGLNLAVERLLDGETPYYPPNDKAGPLSLLPGAIALGTPFAVAGNSAYQNLFWVLVFLITLAWWPAGRPVALALTIGMMALSPAAQHEFISGGDMLSNGLYVPVAMLLCLALGHRRPSPVGLLVVASLLLGICLASRPNYGLLLPPFAVAMWRLTGWRRAGLSAGIAGAVSLGLCLAFYLPDPAGFTPLPTGNKLAAIDLVYPYASKAVILGTLLLTFLAAGFLLKSREERVAGDLFRWSALVTLFPMLAAVILFSWIGGGLDLGFIRDRYGLMYLPFALIGFGIPLLRSRDVPD
jgi:hypothetical protein